MCRLPTSRHVQDECSDTLSPRADGRSRVRATAAVVLCPADRNLDQAVALFETTKHSYVLSHTFHLDPILPVCRRSFQTYLHKGAPMLTGPNYHRYLRTMDRSNLHLPMLRTWNCQSLSLQPGDHLLSNLPVSLHVALHDTSSFSNALSWGIIRMIRADRYSVSAFVILFIEVPLLLRICPTSPVFDNFIRRFETNYMRAAIYFVLSLVQWLSLVTHHTTSLIAAAVLLLIASLCYALAGIKGQAFMNSKTLGGQGVAQMIV
nr:golgi apparatus membrane protein tvp18 [Quercus suber]